MQNLRERPSEDEQTEAAPGTKPVGEIPGAGVHDRVGEKEEGEDVRILLLAEMELVADVDRDDAERLPVEIIQNRGDAEERRDDPSQAGDFHLGASIAEGGDRLGCWAWFRPQSYRTKPSISSISDVLP